MKRKQNKSNSVLNRLLPSLLIGGYSLPAYRSQIARSVGRIASVDIILS